MKQYLCDGLREAGSLTMLFLLSLLICLLIFVPECKLAELRWFLVPTSALAIAVCVNEGQPSLVAILSILSLSIQLLLWFRFLPMQWRKNKVSNSHDLRMRRG